MKLSAGLKLLLLIGLLVLAQTLHSNSLSPIPGLVRITPSETHFISIQDNRNPDNGLVYISNNYNQHWEFFNAQQEGIYYTLRNLATSRYLQCPTRVGQNFQYVDYIGVGVASVKFMITQNSTNPPLYRVKCANPGSTAQELFMGRAGRQVVAQNENSNNTILWQLRPRN